MCGPDPDTKAAVEYAQSPMTSSSWPPPAMTASDVPSYPARLPGRPVGGGRRRSGQVTPYSEYGPAANIAAPGERILSTWNTDRHIAAEALRQQPTPCSVRHVDGDAARGGRRRPGPRPTTRPSARRPGHLDPGDAPPARSGAARPIDGGVLDAGAAVAAAAERLPQRCRSSAATAWPAVTARRCTLRRRAVLR